MAGENSIGKRSKNIFSTKNLTRMAVFTALSFLMYLPFFEFWIIPAVPFLKIDFSNAFVMMAGFSIGPVGALVVGVLKEGLHAISFSTTSGVGELANILIMLPYILIPSLVYQKHRNIKTVFITLGIACAAQAVWSIPVNYTFTFPVFLLSAGKGWTLGMDFYLGIWYWAVLFNFVKTLLVSAVVLLLYKRFQKLFSLIFRETGKSDVGQLRSQTPTGDRHTVNSPEEMMNLGEEISKGLSGGDVVLLTGELGAGKTVFTKGLAKGLGIDRDVVSPTFTIMNEYVDGRIKLCHFDAYRLSGEDEAVEAGLTDYLGSENTVCAVEWWENIPALFDGLHTLTVSIVKTGDGEREVTVTQ